MRNALGARPLKVLELACGTGEVTNVLLSLGHEVTALDFSEAMLAVARRKHAGNDRVRFILADAERTMEPDETYDAVVCRHLVWTLTEPEQAFAEWFRLLKRAAGCSSSTETGRNRRRSAVWRQSRWLPSSRSSATTRITTGP